MKEGFLNYLHYFRGAAILLVVGVHCRTSIAWPEHSFFYDLLYYGLDYATILFVFISGFLFQYLHEKGFQYKPYLIRKLKYVILPYALISVPALLDKLLIETNAYWMTDFYHGLSVPLKIMYMLATGKHSGPFYFIPMIAIIFLLAPAFYALQKQKAFSWIALLIVATGMFSYHYGYYATLGESLFYFIPVYVLGIWASRYRTVTVGISKPIFGLLFLIYISIVSLEMADLLHVYRLKNFSEVQYFFSEPNWGKLKVMCLAVILLNAFYYLRNLNLNLLVVLGNLSFGIYFIHIYFINATEIAIRYFQLSIQQNVFVYLLYLSFILGCSVLTILAIKKIFGKNSRLVIGS